MYLTRFNDLGFNFVKYFFEVVRNNSSSKSLQKCDMIVFSRCICQLHSKLDLVKHGLVVALTIFEARKVLVRSPCSYKLPFSLSSLTPLHVGSESVRTKVYIANSVVVGSKFQRLIYNNGKQHARRMYTHKA